MLSRAKSNIRIRPDLLKNTTCGILPKCAHPAKSVSLTNGYKFRTFKTFTATFAEEQSTQVTNTFVKQVLNDIPASNIVKDQTAQLYLDNVFPLKFASFDIRQLVFRNSKAFLETKTHQAIPSKDLPHDFTIKEIFARTKDGGALVKFSFRSSDEKKAEIANDIVARINEYTLKQNMVAPFNLQSIRAFLVKGSPFLEDIIARYPTQRLRIEFQGEPVNIEKLYSHLRQYGKIFDIALYPNPILAKDPSRYAIAQFTRVRSATSARNCLHGYSIDGTRLNVLYESQLRTNIVKDWLVSHPRITIPVAAALFAGITYAVFDPIRVFFITSKVDQRFNPEEYKLYRWIKKVTWGHFTSFTRDLSKHGRSVWANDPEKTDKLVSWLNENPETFVLITGHSGSGKSALVKSSIEERKNTIIIDCGEVSNGRNMSDMTQILAKEVGYYPVFTWATSLSGLIDTIITATTGQKAGLSTSPDSQIKNILETVAIALSDIAPNEKLAREEVEEEEANRESIMSKLKSLITDETIVAKLDEINKASEEKANEELKDQKHLPIVVIDNFMCRESSKTAKLWETLAEWAALLIENKIAHVVFISSNACAAKTLGAALPGKSFHSIHLSDVPLDKAIEFVRKALNSEIDDPKLTEVVSAIGGRLPDLQLLIQKMKMDMDAETAFEDLVTRNIVDLRKYGLGDSLEDTKLEWTSTQFWTIVKMLSDSKSINYDELKWGLVFRGDDAPLHAMERADLITIVQKDGHHNAIRPGKPIFYTVFDRLVTDVVFAASMEIESNTALKKQSEAEITKLEDQIDRLTHLYLPNKPPKEIDVRIRFLLTKVATVQKQIEEYDSNIKSAKEVIKKNWLDNVEQ